LYHFQIPLLFISRMVRKKDKIAVSLLDFYLASRVLSELREYVSRHGPMRIMCQNLLRLNLASWADARVLQPNCRAANSSLFCSIDNKRLDTCAQIPDLFGNFNAYEPALTLSNLKHLGSTR
jgi:hypothetical protein